MPHDATVPPSGAADATTQGPRASAPNAQRVFNLTFHGVGEPRPTTDVDEKRYWLTVEAFSRFLDRATQWPDVRITFDDGNLSDVPVALPQLLQRRLRGSFFILAARVGQAGYLGRSELRELLAAGMEIGSHGMHHRSWRRLGGDDLRQEIQGAKAALEDMLGIPITQAACPFGEYDRTALQLLAKAGFTRVYTSDRGWARPNAWLQPRNTVTATTHLGDLEHARTWSWARRWAHQLKLTLKRFR
jgi:peptidoglycan/xylan/chitin deacetylase (PgdA/CDA1 family)